MKKIILIVSVFVLFIVACAQQIEETEEKFPEQETQIVSEEKEIKPTEPTKEPEKPKTEIIEETKTDWPTFHGDSARTGFSESKAPSKPNVLWKWTFDDFVKIGYDGNFEGNWPIINDDKVFIAPESIFALELKTGEKIWSYSEEERSFFPRGLAAGSGKLFISVNAGDNLRNLPSGYVYALDEGTGKFLWKYQTHKGVSYSLPLFADNKVFIGDDSGNV